MVLLYFLIYLQKISAICWLKEMLDSFEESVDNNNRSIVDYFCPEIVNANNQNNNNKYTNNINNTTSITIIPIPYQSLRITADLITQLKLLLTNNNNNNNNSNTGSFSSLVVKALLAVWKQYKLQLLGCDIRNLILKLPFPLQCLCEVALITYSEVVYDSNVIDSNNGASSNNSTELPMELLQHMERYDILYNNNDNNNSNNSNSNNNSSGTLHYTNKEWSVTDEDGLKLLDETINSNKLFNNDDRCKEV